MTMLFIHAHIHTQGDAYYCVTDNSVTFEGLSPAFDGDGGCLFVPFGADKEFFWQHVR